MTACTIKQLWSSTDLHILVQRLDVHEASVVIGLQRFKQGS
jgi:hypothetical protein